MLVQNNEIEKNEFLEKQKFNNWEVFTPEQVAQYAGFISNLIKKSETGDLKESQKETLRVGKAELANLKSVRIVEMIDNRIIKSLVFFQDPQIKFEDVIEKSETGEEVKGQKGVFLDTPLNRELGRVGEEFMKGCSGKKKVEKSEDEEDEYEGKEKEDEDDEEEEDDDKEEMDEPELQKSIDEAVSKINDNFNKGLIGEDLVSKAFNEIDNMIQKSRPTKYFKREGGPGHYKYYYTEADYKKAKGGDKIEGKMHIDRNEPTKNIGLFWDKMTYKERKDFLEKHNLVTEKLAINYTNVKPGTANYIPSAIRNIARDYNMNNIDFQLKQSMREASKKEREGDSKPEEGKK